MLKLLLKEQNLAVLGTLKRYICANSSLCCMVYTNSKIIWICDLKTPFTYLSNEVFWWTVATFIKAFARDTYLNWS